MDTLPPNTYEEYSRVVDKYGNESMILINKIDIPLPKIFKINGSYESPSNLNYNILGFHKKRIILKGELKCTEYYRDYDGSEYSDLILSEYRIYNREPNLTVQTRDMKIDWYLLDETVGESKETTKYYTQYMAIKEGSTMRKNIILEIKVFILDAFGIEKGSDLLFQVSKEIDMFINGSPQSLVNTINNIFYLENEVKQEIVNILTI